MGEMDDVPEGMLSPTGSSTGEKLGFPDAGGMLGDPTTPTMLEKRKQKRQRMGMGKFHKYNVHIFVKIIRAPSTVMIQ